MQRRLTVRARFDPCHRLALPLMLLFAAFHWHDMAGASGVVVTPPEAPPSARSLAEAREIARRSVIGPYSASNELERDVETAALLDAEFRALTMLATRDNDPAARARRNEIVESLQTLQARHENWGDRPGNFITQYYVLGGRLTGTDE